MYQADPPRSPKETLPTMYELPSEALEEPGLPDEFYLLQPRLLSDTFCPPEFLPEQVFTASDLNLYYDPRHTSWYKQPDWFAVVGVPRLYEQRDLRLSYVVWQEGITPMVVVELLSPGTALEDLGQTLREINQPPTKWEVYEQILHVPYYIIFDRHANELQAFQLVGRRYTNLESPESRVWMPELKMGLGLWSGSCQGIERLWLRYYDAQGDWILTPLEQQTQQLAQEQHRVQRLIEQLQSLGIEPHH